MVDMKEAYRWGNEMEQDLQKRRQRENAVQTITYGGKTITCKKGKKINFIDFFK